MLESVCCGHKWSEHYSQFLSIYINILDNTLEPEESPSAGHKKEYEFKARFLWTGNLDLS